MCPTPEEEEQQQRQRTEAIKRLTKEEQERDERRREVEDFINSGKLPNNLEKEGVTKEDLEKEVAKIREANDQKGFTLFPNLSASKLHNLFIDPSQQGAFNKLFGAFAALTITGPYKLLRGAKRKFYNPRGDNEIAEQAITNTRKKYEKPAEEKPLKETAQQGTAPKPEEKEKEKEKEKEEKKPTTTITVKKPITGNNPEQLPTNLALTNGPTPQGQQPTTVRPAEENVPRLT